MCKILGLIPNNKRFNTELPYDPWTTLTYKGKRTETETQPDTQMPVLYSWAIDTSQEIEATQLSARKRMNKQNMIYTHNGILVSKK